MSKKKHSHFPSWDLMITLEHLMGSSFEPLTEPNMRQLTKKMMFLVALTTAKRIAELQAISAIVPSQNNDLLLFFYQNLWQRQSLSGV